MLKYKPRGLSRGLPLDNKNAKTEGVYLGFCTYKGLAR